MKCYWALLPMVAAAALSSCGHEPTRRMKSPASAPAPKGSAAAVVAAASVGPSPISTEAPVEPDPSAISIAVFARPPSFTLDGDISEWGSRNRFLQCRGDPRCLEPNLGEDYFRDQETRKGSATASQVVVAVTSTGVTIAADLRGKAAGEPAPRGHDRRGAGIWLGIAAQYPELGPIGHLQRGGGVMELNCERNPYTGESLPAAEAASCRAIVARHESFLASYRSQFVRMYRLDTDRVQAVTKAGLEPIDGSRVVAVTRRTSTTIEATLPLAAMPMLSEPSLTSLAFVAAAAADAQPETDRTEAWWSRDVPPVQFEPMVSLREIVLAQQRMQSWSTRWLAYHPSRPLELSITYYDYDGPVAITKTKPLFVKNTDFRGFEVGSLDGRLVVLSKGEIWATTTCDDPIMGQVRRGADLHVFAFEVSYLSDVNRNEARWSACAIAEDGSIRENPLIQPVDEANWGINWETVKPFHSPTFNTFGMQGTNLVYDSESARTSRVSLRLTWRYDKHTNTYLQDKGP